MARYQVETCKGHQRPDYKAARFNLRDYLVPGAVWPYKDLASDMESALQKIGCVYLYSVPGFLVVSGYKGSTEPWSTCDAFSDYFKTAKEALRN